MSRFTSLATVPVSLGPCRCPETPHPEDTAEVYTTLGWDDLVDVGAAESDGAGRRILVTRAIASWNLVDEVETTNPKTGQTSKTILPVPVIEATVRLLDSDTLTVLAETVNAAYERAKEPVPNGSGAPSEDSSPESAARAQKKTPKPTTST